MSLSVVMRTLNRTPRTNFLGQTMANLYRSGLWESEAVKCFQICDSGSQDQHEFFKSNVYPMLPSSITSQKFLIDAPSIRRTHNGNAARAVELASRVVADWVLILEDDIDVCGKFFDSVALWLSMHALPEYPLFTFGTTWPGVRVATQQGYSASDYPIDHFYGAQAYAVRMKDAAHLAEWLYAHPQYTVGGKVKDQCHDLLLHDWARERYPGATHFLASAPSFVQHTGTESALNNTFFTFETFPGIRWSYAR